MENTISEKKITKSRIWELDVLKTFAFLVMVFDHLSYDMGFILRTNVVNNQKLYDVCLWFYKYKASQENYYINFFLSFGLFIFLSGICSTLSRNAIKRGLKLLIVATIFSVGTIVFQYFTPQLLGFKMLTAIYFGILSCIAVLTICSPLLKKIPNYIAIPLALIAIGLGLYIRQFFFSNNIFYIFGFHTESMNSADYQPLIPALGIYLLGIVVGKVLYKNKTSIFKVKPKLPVCTFIAKHSLVLYFAHQAILLIITYLLIFFIR